MLIRTEIASEMLTGTYATCIQVDADLSLGFRPVIGDEELPTASIVPTYVLWASRPLVLCQGILKVETVCSTRQNADYFADHMFCNFTCVSDPG